MSVESQIKIGAFFDETSTVVGISLLNKDVKNN